MNNGTRALLDSANWEKIIKQLSAFVGHFYSWMRIEEREDIVMTAIQKVFTEEQAWDPNNRSLLNHLKLVCRSVGWSQMRSARQGKEVATDFTSTDIDLHVDLRKEETAIIDLQSHIELTKQRLQGDDEALLVLLAIEEGAGTPRQIVEVLGITLAQARAAIKRISYHSRKF